MSLALAVEALAFVHKTCVFFCGHTAGTSTARCHIHGVGITFSAFTVKSLTPLVQILPFGWGLVLLVVTDPQNLSPM